MERDSIGGVVIKFAQVFMFILLVLFCYQCNPPTKKHQLKVEISRKLLQGEFL